MLDSPLANPGARSLLHLMHLVSPALPVGAYAYSQGFEYAVERGWLTDRETARDWIEGVMTGSIASLDLPVLARLYQAWQQGDEAAALYWNEFLQAARESAEFELEDIQLGMALLRLLQALEVPQALRWSKVDKPSFATMFALAGVHWQIALADLLHGFCWSWLENQVAAATKLVPLGQTDAQKILLALMPALEGAVASSYSVSDDALGAGLPGLAMASAQHETQYSRLFRS